MLNRLGQLLNENRRLYGVICRDATAIDVELLALAGFHIVWFDLEHCPQPTEEIVHLARLATHLGLVPLVRIPELIRTHVQLHLDGGVQIIALPDIQHVDEAHDLVRLGKYPPIGQRGISTTIPAIDFALGPDPKQQLEQVNDATHLMVIFESDRGYEALDAILGVDGVDLIAVGPNDWSVSLNLYGDAAQAYLAPKIERIIRNSVRAGKIVAMGVAGPDAARRYVELGARVLFVGVDVAIKRRALMQALSAIKNI